MSKKKLTLEDLKLESFLTELDDAKLVKVQGGHGYDDGGDKPDKPDDGPYPDKPDKDTKHEACYETELQNCWDTQQECL